MLFYNQEKREMDSADVGTYGGKAGTGMNTPKKKIDMEGVYRALDSGIPLQELLQRMGVGYWILYKRHKSYQESLAGAGNRDCLVKYGQSGKKRVHVPMEWVYAQVEEGRKVEDIANELGVGERTLYRKHEEYRALHPGSRKAGNTLAGMGSRNSRPRKRVDMESVYEMLIGGKTIREVLEECGISYPTLKAHHEEYQKGHQGENTRYTRRRLVDFKKGKK